MTLTRFSVPPLHTVTRSLGAVAMGREAPDLVITGGRLLSTYTERIHADREIWVKSGRIAAVKPAGTYMALVKAAKSIGPKTTPEVEFVLFTWRRDIYVTLGNDQCDIEIEARG